MQIYEYKCTECGHVLEVIQKISDSPLKKCPACNQMSLVKQVTAASFKLQGTGWYETDFKNKKKPEPKSSSSNNTKKDKTASKKSSNKEK